MVKTSRERAITELNVHACDKTVPGCYLRAAALSRALSGYSLRASNERATRASCWGLSTEQVRDMLPLP